MVEHLSSHPLFRRIPDEEIEGWSGPEREVVEKVRKSTEEGQKVARNEGDKYLALFRRISEEDEMKLVLA